MLTPVQAQEQKQSAKPQAAHLLMPHMSARTTSAGALLTLLCLTLRRYHTIDQYALIDLPAQVNTALEKTGASKLGLVGHSQVRIECCCK
jgi:hypothetical protein